MLRGVRNMLEGGQKLRGGGAPPPKYAPTCTIRKYTFVLLVSILQV